MNNALKSTVDGVNMFTEDKYPSRDYLPDEYVDDPYHLLKSADEIILRPQPGASEPKPKPVEPEPEEPVAAVEDEQPSSFDDVVEQIDDFKKTLDPKKLKDAWTNLINILKGKSDFKEPLAAFVTRVYYKTIKTPEAQRSKEILKNQLSRLLIFPIGLWVLINWWYLINHTTFTVNIMKYADYFPGLIKPVVEAPLYAIDVLNYYLINMREDGKLSPFMCSALKTLWGWRPVVFFIMLMIFSAIYANVDLNDAIGVTAGLSGTANGFMFMLSIFAFLYFNLCESRLGKIMQLTGGGTTGIIVTVVMFLIGFILMLAICAIGTSFYSMFFIFISFFAVVAFGFPNVPGEISNVLRVVRSAPVNNPNATGWFEKTLNILFQNFMDIILATALIPVLIHQIGETYHGVSNQNMMITMMMFQVFLLTMYFRKVSYPVLHPLFDMIDQIIGEKKTALSEIAKTASGYNAMKSQMGDAINKLGSIQGTDPTAALANAAALGPTSIPSASSFMKGLMPK